MSRSMINLLYASERVQRNKSIHYNCNFRMAQTLEMPANTKENKSTKNIYIMISGPIECQKNKFRANK